MTPNAARFVGAVTFEALSGNPVFMDLFEPGEQGGAVRHIEWAETADAVIIAPATADIIGKLAGGIADDVLSTLMLAVTAPILLCPSMNTRMYLSRPVQRNLEILSEDGITIVTPDSGVLACGTTGPGRLPEPVFIFDRLIDVLTSKDLSGRTVLVSAGPTREPIDPVRYISNPSSGKMGFSIAKAASYRGADVILVTGPTHLSDPADVKTLRITTAKEMENAVMEHAEHADIIIKSAAVSDYRPMACADHKIKKGQAHTVIELEKTTDILRELGKSDKKRILVGFAAETQDMESYARKKIADKNLDMIVGNIVGPKSGFGTDTNQVTLFYKDGTHEALKTMEKDRIAHAILDRVVQIIT